MLRKLHKAYLWIRFGKIHSVIRSIDGDVASEIEYIDHYGKAVGYWAYGKFDPAYPYRG